MESLLVFIALLTVTCLVGHWLHLKRCAPSATGCPAGGHHQPPLLGPCPQHLCPFPCPSLPDISHRIPCWLPSGLFYRIHWVTEGALALLVGLAAGGAAYAYFEVHAGERIPTKLFYFDTELFFDVALPAIMCDRAACTAFALSSLLMLVTVNPNIQTKHPCSCCAVPRSFNAGFSVKKKLFFQNFMTLVLFGAHAALAIGEAVLCRVYACQC